MWLRNHFKLSVVLYLMILANLAQAEVPTESFTDSSIANANPIEDVTGDSIVAENLNIESDIVQDQPKVSGVGDTLTPEAAEVESTTLGESEGSGVQPAPEVVNTADPLEDNPSSVTDSSSITESPSQSEQSDQNVETVTVVESATESVTDQIDCVCDCTANGSQVKVECTTHKEQQDTPIDVPENSESNTSSSSSNNDSNTLESERTETSTTSNDNSETTTESQTADETNTPQEATTEFSDTPLESTSASHETTTESVNDPPETTTPLPLCSTPGVQPHVTDCRQYYDCSSEGSLDGSFHLLTKSCPDKQAFNPELNRCSRDISSCSNPIECLVKGGIADSTSNTSYYYCEPRLIAGGFRIFRIDCSTNEIFYPELGKCFVDFNNLPSQWYPPYNWNQIEDIDIVKAEMKLLKEQDKLKLKQEKDRLKAEENLQKQQEKEAKKRAKEEEKAKKEQAKKESSTFVCVEEGNFESTVGGNTYIACINKKGKLKALGMQCPIGSKFNGVSGTCVNNSTNNNGADTDNDDDDEDDD